MRLVGYRLSARTIGLALVAGFIGLEAVLALGAGAIGIPGLFLLRLADKNDEAAHLQRAEAPDSAESVVTKRPEQNASPKPSSGTTGSAAPNEGEPRLEGLSDIPLKPWDHDEEESPSSETNAKAETHQEPEVLPWDAVEPVPLDGATPPPAGENSAPVETRPSPPPSFGPLPSERNVAGWVKTKATEIKGEDRSRPLFHFEFWLEAPPEVARSLASVRYDFNTPAVLPQPLLSTEAKTGFRASAGGLTCADKVTVTLRYKDGRSQHVEVDGCALAEASSAHTGDLGH
jgi:cell division septation protein DedD